MTDLKDALLAEQGFICAYTGIRIDNDSMHIEHLKPRHHRVYLEDVRYTNLVACFPKEDEGGSSTVGFGARAKDRWWHATNFVSPLDQHCETRFRYTEGGAVRPNPVGHVPATTTIKKLNLNDKKLKQLRHAAILSFFGLNASKKRSGRKNRKMTRQEALVWQNDIDRMNTSGKLQPYCFVMKQLLPTYLANLP